MEECRIGGNPNCGNVSVRLTGNSRLHPLGRVDSDQMQATRDHELRRAAEPEPERLPSSTDHADVVVEAMEVVGDLDRVDRDPLRRPPLSRLARNARETRPAA